MLVTRAKVEFAAKTLGVNFNTADFTLDDFLRGMSVELEHGKINFVTNFTDNDLVKTAKIVLAHMIESPRYYDEKIGLETRESFLGKSVKSSETAREHKAFKFMLENVDENGEFTGYASVYGNVDDGDDIVEKGAFAKTIKEDFDRIKILLQHNAYEPPIGKPIELREDEKGLFIRGKISNTQKGRDVLTLLKDGVLKELSIGYDAIVFEIDEQTGIRHLKELKLWEVSIVTWAMNELARVEDVKTLVDVLKTEAKNGKITRSRLDALKPFIAVVRELADILSPFLEPLPTTEPVTQDNIKKTKQIKQSGIIFEIIPTKNRR